MSFSRQVVVVPLNLERSGQFHRPGRGCEACRRVEIARESAARPLDAAERGRLAHQRKPGTETGAAGRAEQCLRLRIMHALHGWWFLPAIPDPARLTRRSLTPNSGQGDTLESRVR